VRRSEEVTSEPVSQDSLYEVVANSFGPSLIRLARAYEMDPDARRDLLQEIHLHLWRSLASFDARCSLRTWVYRIAHNVATSHVIRQRKIRISLVGIENVDDFPIETQTELGLSQAEALERLSSLIRRLKPLDRQIIVSYLEGMNASAISEITGLSQANVAIKIHRIKIILTRWHGDQAMPAK
jgi:RNA polymerase sigma-70 factor (ECF subfamily)